MANIQISTGAYSVSGIKDKNEDCYGITFPQSPQQQVHKGISAAIADGMSGSEAGKEASHCCIKSFLADYYSTPDSWSVKQAGQKILSATNSWLYTQGQTQHGSYKGMVSTLSVLVMKSTTAYIFHVGDSRIYRIHHGNLEQLTRDHRVTVSADKCYLNRAMGIESHLEVDYKAIPMEVGDIFFMSTDGLHDFVDHKQLRAFLAEDKDLNLIAKTIVESAKDNHSDDNLTCQIIRIDKLPLEEEDEVISRSANLPFPPPLEPGNILDGYRIEEELHASKRTQIYRAFDTLNKQTVILKTPSILFEDDTQYIEHFLYEEWVARRISHDNVISVLGAERKKTCIYYVTEYLPGGTLRDWIENNPKPYIRDTRKIIEQIARGLRSFHRMEMLHQDLKPENIMFDANGNIKIIDFGSVKISGVAEMHPDDHNENVLGTLNYTAPEYHLGLRGSIKSEIYSLGVITYEMINGALPFGRDMPEKPNKSNLAKLNYIPSFHCNTMVPIWIDETLKKATNLNPATRYDQISEFIHDLSTPNPKFLSINESIPLIERNPLVFWQTISALLFLCNFVLFYFLVAK